MINQSQSMRAQSQEMNGLGLIVQFKDIPKEQITLEVDVSTTSDEIKEFLHELLNKNPEELELYSETLGRTFIELKEVFQSMSNPAETPIIICSQTIENPEITIDVSLKGEQKVKIQTKNDSNFEDIFKFFENYDIYQNHNQQIKIQFNDGKQMQIQQQDFRKSLSYFSINSDCKMDLVNIDQFSQNSIQQIEKVPNLYNNINQGNVNLNSLISDINQNKQMIISNPNSYHIPQSSIQVQDDFNQNNNGQDVISTIYEHQVNPFQPQHHQNLNQNIQQINNLNINQSTNGNQNQNMQFNPNSFSNLQQNNNLPNQNPSVINQYFGEPQIYDPNEQVEQVQHIGNQSQSEQQLEFQRNYEIPQPNLNSFQILSRDIGQHNNFFQQRNPDENEKHTAQKNQLNNSTPMNYSSNFDQIRFNSQSKQIQRENNLNVSQRQLQQQNQLFSTNQHSETNQQINGNYQYQQSNNINQQQLTQNQNFDRQSIPLLKSSQNQSVREVTPIFNRQFFWNNQFVLVDEREYSVSYFTNDNIVQCTFLRERSEYINNMNLIQVNSDYDKCFQYKDTKIWLFGLEKRCIVIWGNGTSMSEFRCTMKP